MATTNNSRTNRRYTSSLSAAREGWHRWAGRHWGWFVPLMASIGMVRGSYRGVRRVIRFSDRTGRWMNRVSVQLLSLHPRTRPAAVWLRRVTRTPDTTRIDCAYCGISVAADRAEAHLNAHQAQAARPQGRAANPAATSPNVVPIRRRPSPRPRSGSTGGPSSSGGGVVHNVHDYCLTFCGPGCTARAGSHGFRCGKCGLDQAGFTEAEAKAFGQAHVCAGSNGSTTAPATPAAASSSHTGGNTMASNNSGTPETLQLTRAALVVGEMDPKTAWELDAQFQGMARSLFTLSEALGQWIETLDAIKTDPRVTAQAGIAVGEIAEVVRTFSVCRQLYRNLYAAQFAAAENGVRQVQRQNFFNPNAA